MTGTVQVTPLAITALVAPLLAAPTWARADRATTLSVQGGMQMAAAADAPADEVERSALLGLSLTWDRPPPPLPLERNTRVGRLDLSPEATILADGSSVMILGGARLELEMSEHAVGLLALDSRTTLWVAPKLGAITRGDSLVLGGDFGMQLHHGSGWYAGGWMGIYGWREEADVMDLPGRPPPDPTFDDGVADDTVLQLQLGVLVGSPL